MSDAAMPPGSEAGAASGAGGSPDGLPPLREVIGAIGLDARKSLGQNFILDFNILRRIARAAGPLEGCHVIEVGPGPGGLTRALLAEGAGSVTAIEKDTRCLPALEAISARYPGRLAIRMGDALAFDWATLAGPAEGRRPTRIVANLPYNVASRLLVGWLEPDPWPPWWERMTLMFQREVADRLVAVPATKPYGRLSVLSQWRAEVRLLFTLPPQAFTPQPKISSAVVEYRPRAAPAHGCSAVILGAVTAAAFGQRRKMLRQSLRAVSGDATEEILRAIGVAPEARGETLSPTQFAELARSVEELRKPAGPGGQI